jgi:GNAT superfamily N-acetyltransferase
LRNAAVGARMNMLRDGYEISGDKSRLDVDAIHAFLVQSYWAAGIPRGVVERSIEGALCFGIYHSGRQVGFARVVTDGATFAYLADVFVLEAHRGLGLAHEMLRVVFSHPQLQGLRRFMLATRDAHGLYEEFGFTALSKPDRIMERLDPDVYRKP